MMLTSDFSKIPGFEAIQRQIRFPTLRHLCIADLNKLAFMRLLTRKVYPEENRLSRDIGSTQSASEARRRIVDIVRLNVHSSLESVDLLSLRTGPDEVLKTSGSSSTNVAHHLPN